jgi:hypothetical protein
MSLPHDIKQREYQKFGLTDLGQTAVRVLTFPGDDQEPENYEALNIYDEALLVPNGSEQVIASYAVPAGKTFFMALAEAFGSNVATFRVDIDGQTVAKGRTWFNGGLGVNFSFNDSRGLGLKVDGGKTIEVMGVHSRPNPGDFEARILGVLKNV